MTLATADLLDHPRVAWDIGDKGHARSPLENCAARLPLINQR